MVLYARRASDNDRFRGACVQKNVGNGWLDTGRMIRDELYRSPELLRFDEIA